MPMITGSCGHHMHDSDRFCPVYGAPQRRARMRQVVMLAVGVLLAGAFGVGLAMGGSDPEPMEQSMSGVAALEEPTGAATGSTVNQSNVTSVIEATNTLGPSPTATPVPPTPTPQSTNTPVPPTPTPLPSAGTVLYDSAVSGWDGWQETGGWLVSRGVMTHAGDTMQLTTLTPPYDVQTISNYAVEAVVETKNVDLEVLSILVRHADDKTGYLVGQYSRPVSYNKCIVDSLVDHSFVLDTVIAWSNNCPMESGGTYMIRVEVFDNEVKMLIDGIEHIAVRDSLYLTGGGVGIWGRDQLIVHSFKVIAL